MFNTGAGWPDAVAQKTEGRAGGLHKRAVRRAAEKDGVPAEKDSPPARPFLQPSLMCNPPARSNMQPTGPACSVACRLLSSSWLRK